MAGVPDRLAPLRSVFWNPDRTSGLTCAVCTTPSLSTGYTNCYPCNGHMYSGHPTADLVAPVTYAVDGTQAMSDLYNYKSSAVSDQTRTAARDRLFNVLYLALERHLSCFGPIQAIATVPSSGGRNGAHPVDEMRRMFGEGFTQLDMTYVGPAGLDRAQRRVLDPQRFRVDANKVRGQRVLLLDDAWVSGVHIQSAAGALKLAGAAGVAAVPIGRVVSPSYTEAKAYLEDHRPPPPFSPDVCPVSGQPHT